MHTRVRQMFDIEYPIFAFSHCRDVVAAVSKTGGLGVLGATDHTPEQLEIDLTWIAANNGGRPYGVDLLLPGKYEGAVGGAMTKDEMQAAIPAGHREFVELLLERFDVPHLPDDERGLIHKSLTITPEQYEPLIDIAFAHSIALIASALGPPPPDLVERAHRAGVKVAGLAGAPKHAVRHRDAGVDLVIAQGTEAGGHTGEISTMVLVPQVVDAVAPTPVLAAGGIATGRHIAAAMALGAEGVWCGSVWLTTEEAETNPAVVQKFLRATSADTLRSTSLTGKTARVLRSAWTDAWDAPDAPAALPMPLQGALVDEPQRRVNRAAANGNPGGVDLAQYFVGQVVGYLNTVRPARRVVLDMVTEYVEATDRMFASTGHGE